MAITLEKNVFSFQRDIEKECPDVLNWGVMKVEIAESDDGQYLSFLHPVLQWFAAAWYISKEVERVHDKQVPSHSYYRNLRCTVC